MIKKLLFLSLCCALILPLSLSGQRSKFKDESRFVYVTNLQMLSGIGSLEFDNRSNINNSANFGIQQVFAYQFNNHFFMGVGTGLSIWKKSTFIPLFMNLSVSFIDRRVTPHWNLNAGYSFKWYTDSRPDKNRLRHGTTPGLFGETGLGIKFNAKETLAILFMVNYSIQHSYVEYSDELQADESYAALYGNASAPLFYQFIGVKLGIQF